MQAGRSPVLRAIVEQKLARRWSPKQIDDWLKLTTRRVRRCRVSHESIYRTLYVGVRLPDGRGGRPNTLHISHRPAEAEDRAVPGHWEGDLVFGKNMSPAATLVERKTRFLMPVALPGGNHQADAVADTVADALAPTITTLPTQLEKSLT